MLQNPRFYLPPDQSKGSFALSTFTGIEQKGAGHSLNLMFWDQTRGKCTGTGAVLNAKGSSDTQPKRCLLKKR